MKNKTRFYIVLAVILAAFCAISFLIPFERNSFFYIAFVFGILAILIQLYTFPKAFFQGRSAKSKFYGFPLEYLTIGYLAVQLVLSLAFMAIAKLEPPKWVAVLASILIFAMTAIGFVSADAMRDEIERQDVKLKKNVSKMRSFQSKVSNLAINAPTECRAVLDKLSDEFRFSDPVSVEALEDIERELAACIDELENAVADADAEAIPGLCRKTSLTLAERNRLCKLSK